MNRLIKFLFYFLPVLFVTNTFSQVANPQSPRTMWVDELNYIKNGQFTFTYKTLDAPVLTGVTSLTTTNALTSGTYRSFTVGHTQTAATSGVIEALRVNIDANVATGNWTNAVVARVDYGATGNANGGMVAPLCAELSLPPAALSGGAYYVADLEIEAPENYVSHGNVSLPTAWFNIATYGNATAIASLEDNAFLFRTDGFTSASGNMIYNNTIRARVGSTTWYMPLSSAEGEYETAYLIDVTNTTDASSLTAASIQTDGGLAVAKQLYIGDDLDMSVSGTGVYDITLKDGVADALSIVRGTTDVIVFDTSTPKVTITPAVDITGLLTANGGVAMGGALSGVTTIAASGKYTGGGDIETDDAVIADELRLGHSVLDSLGRTLLYVQNKNGGSLAEGDACVWDNAAVVVVADAAMADPATVANDLSGEGGFMSLVVTMTGTADAGDSIKVYGWQYETGDRDSVALLIPAENGVTFMINDTTTATLGLPIHWSNIDSVVFNADAIADGATSCIVNAYGVATIKACDGGNTDFAGVAVETIADNAFGYICVHGVCKATVDAATLNATPGVLLEGAANGDLVTGAAAITGQNVGRCLESSTVDDKKILVFIDSY
jgi:hypothetical protein